MDSWMWVPVMLIGGYLLLCLVLIPIGLATGDLTFPNVIDQKPRTTKPKTCKVCEHDRFAVTAEGGGAENIVCEKCGSLHLNGPFGLELLRTGQPAPKVVLPDGEKIKCETDAEALEHCAAWNKVHHPRGGIGDPGAYVIDSEGVMATDPLAPYGYN